MPSPFILNLLQEGGGGEVVDVTTSPAYYQRESLPIPNKTTITISPTWINCNGTGDKINEAVTLDLNEKANWWEGSWQDPDKRKGKDCYIYYSNYKYLSQKFILSSSPTSLPKTYFRLIGGFHCLCADVGEIEGHALSGYVAGDILPLSVWDLHHRPVSNPEGMVCVNGRWYDIYLASYDGTNLASAYDGKIITGETEYKCHGEKFVEEFGKINKRLLSRDEFLVVADGSNQKTHMPSASDNGRTGGHVDTVGRRMISNYGLEDCCGAYHDQWTNNTYVLPTSPVGISAVEQTEASAGEHNMDYEGYSWQSDGRGVNNITVDSALNTKGVAMGALVRLTVGGIGKNNGSRTVDGNNLSSNALSTAARGSSEMGVSL